MKLVKNFTMLDGNVGGTTYSVGRNKINTIQDLSLEYEDHWETILSCFDEEGQLLRSVINCPVDIEYI